MTYKIFISLLFCSFTFGSYSQSNDVLKKAIQLGDSLKFEEARTVLQTEIKQHPNNAEAYYCLGRYAHYLVYDSRPFMKKSNDWSKKEVLANLTKATALKPNLGDAYYFIAAEYGCRAREALKLNNMNQAKTELKEAKKAGGFPEVALEYARCILNSCDRNAILFTNWDAPGNSLMYVQLIEGLRKDVSVIIVNLLDRPYYIKLLQNGISNEITKVPISWNDYIIMDMHSYFPWKEQPIQIKISSQKKSAYKIPDSINNFTLLVKDKYGSGSMWMGTAAILNMLENNKFERPVYTALPYEDDMFEFTDYLQNEGFVSKLMPYKVDHKFNAAKFEATILNANNYRYFSDIKIHNQPRADYFFGDNRRNIIMDYVQFLLQSNKKEQAKAVYEKMNALMPPSTYPLSNDLKKRCTEVEKKLSAD